MANGRITSQPEAQKFGLKIADKLDALKNGTSAAGDTLESILNDALDALADDAGVIREFFIFVRGHHDAVDKLCDEIKKDPLLKQKVNLKNKVDEITALGHVPALIAGLNKLNTQTVNDKTIEQLELLLIEAINQLKDDSYAQRFARQLIDAKLEVNGLVGAVTKDDLKKRVTDITDLSRRYLNQLSNEDYINALISCISPKKKDKELSPLEEASITTAKIDLTIKKSAANSLPATLDQLRNFNQGVTDLFKNFNTKLHLIDPFSVKFDLNDTDNKILTALLKQLDENYRHPNALKKSTRWDNPFKLEKNKTYEVDIDNGHGGKIKQHVRLTHDIQLEYQFVRNPYKSYDTRVPIFRIYANNSASITPGKHGIPNLGAGTIKLRHDKSGHVSAEVKKPKNKILMKTVTQNRAYGVLIQDTPDSAKSEFLNLKRFNPKSKAVISQRKTIFASTSVIVDDYFDGPQLRKIIEEQALTPKKDDFLLKITINTLYNLKQIQPTNRIHNDIKPENILANEKTGKTLIIDAGAARSTKKWFQFGGKKDYRAPEKKVLGTRLSVDQRSDIYSLGLSLLELWRANEKTSKDTTGKAVIATLNGMIKEKKDDRTSIDDLISELEKNHRLLKASNEVKTAFDYAYAMRTQLFRQSSFSKTEIRDVVFEYLNSLDTIKLNKAKAIEEFKYTANIEALKDPALDDVKKMQDRVKAIINEFISHNQELSIIRHKVMTALDFAKKLPKSERDAVRTELSVLLDDLNIRIQKSKDSGISLDSMAKANKKIDDEHIITNFKKRLNEVDVHSSPSVNSYFKVLRELVMQPQTLDDKNDKKKYFDNAINTSIYKYLVKDFTKKRASKAAGHRRLDDIDKVLDILKHSQNAGESDDQYIDRIKTEINDKLDNNMKKGPLAAYSRLFSFSKFNDRIKAAMESWDKPKPKK